MMAHRRYSEKMIFLAFFVGLCFLNADCQKIVSVKPLCQCVGGFSGDLLTPSNCLADCNGNYRDANEVDCTFPFNFNGVWYDKCTNVSRGFYWCSIDKVYNGRYATCSQACPGLARNQVKNIPGAVHTSCLDTAPGFVSLNLTANDIQLILNEHNNIRANVTVPAADMRAVTWDWSLARLAQRWAENGQFQHDCQACRTLLNNRTLPIGQNLYTTSTSLPYNGQSFWTAAIAGWYSEILNFQFGVGNIPGNTKPIGHYTQMVYSGVSRIGCAAAQKGNFYLAVCNYAQLQVSQIYPYVAGKPGTQCSPQNFTNNLCRCNKLCQNYGVLDPINCKCNCNKWSTGEECEIKLCNQSDASYGCWGADVKFCGFNNIAPNCPHLCGPCDYYTP